MTDGIDSKVQGRIVVGVDGSAASKDALAWAARQAEMTGATLRAVISWRAPAGAYGVPMEVPGGYNFCPEAESTLDETIRDVLGEHAGIEVSAVVANGAAAPSLLWESAGADLLVVGSRGHGEFAGMLLGSVAQHCVAHAPCPVVVVRHAKHRSATA